MDYVCKDCGSYATLEYYTIDKERIVCPNCAVRYLEYRARQKESQLEELRGRVDKRYKKQLQNHINAVGFESKYAPILYREVKFLKEIKKILEGK